LGAQRISHAGDALVGFEGFKRPKGIPADPDPQEGIGFAKYRIVQSPAHTALVGIAQHHAEQPFVNRQGYGGGRFTARLTVIGPIINRSVTRRAVDDGEFKISRSRIAKTVKLYDSLVADHGGGRPGKKSVYHPAGFGVIHQAPGCQTENQDQNSHARNLSQGRKTNFHTVLSSFDATGQSLFSEAEFDAPSVQRSLLYYLK
jgi:hypothetical protein